jgi:DNA-directed RNA polymerase specialized sigma24 family protein
MTNSLTNVQANAITPRKALDVATMVKFSKDAMYTNSGLQVPTTLINELDSNNIFKNLISELVLSTHATSIKKIAYNTVINGNAESSIDDVIQDTYILAITNLHLFTDYKFFFSRIKQFSKNAVAKIVHRNRKFKMSNMEKNTEGFKKLESLGSKSFDGFSALQLDLMNQLTEEEQTVFTLMVGNYTMLEMKAILGKSAQKLVAKIRTKLQAYIMESSQA